MDANGSAINAVCSDHHPWDQKSGHCSNAAVIQRLVNSCSEMVGNTGLTVAKKWMLSNSSESTTITS
jgi:hypothetical protein